MRDRAFDVCVLCKTFCSFCSNDGRFGLLGYRWLERLRSRVRSSCRICPLRHSTHSSSGLLTTLARVLKSPNISSKHVCSESIVALSFFCFLSTFFCSIVAANATSRDSNSSEAVREVVNWGSNSGLAFQNCPLPVGNPFVCSMN